jgi:hypothetical protein
MSDADLEGVIVEPSDQCSGTALVVGDGDLFSCFDEANCVDSFAFCITVPAIVSIGETAVVDEANGRVDSANHRVCTTRQSVGFHNTAEGVLAREVVVKGKELPFLSLR